MSIDAQALLAEATGLTEALVQALQCGDATTEEILSTLARREQLLRELATTSAASEEDHRAVARLEALDACLVQHLEDRRRAVASQLATARKRNASPESPPRLVEESA